MAGLAGPPFMGTSGITARTVAKHHPLSCHHEALLLPLQNSSLCLSCSVVSSRVSRWNCARASVDVGHAASIELPSTTLEAETDLPSTSEISWGQIALQGPRSEMEDAFVIRSDGLNGFNYAAVFDGHAGFSSVKFLREELHTECRKSLNNGSVLVSSDFSTIEDAITSAFLQADNRLLSWLEETGDEIESGSTATVLFLGGDNLIVAHVGDSRAVISRAGKAEVMCGDHRPYGKSKSALNEIKRIRQAGGWINNGRVCGILSVSRAFGDIKLKTRRQDMLDEGVKDGLLSSKFVSRIEMNGDWVTAAPEVAETNIADAEFIILASDGLWDYVQSSEAVRIVRNQLQRHGDPQRACEVLANTALGKNGQDNITIIVADLGRVQRQPNASLEDDNLGSEVGQLVLTLGIVGLGIWLSQFASQVPLW